MVNDDLLAELARTEKIMARIRQDLVEIDPQHPLLDGPMAIDSVSSEKLNTRGGTLHDHPKTETVYRKGQGPFQARGAQRLARLGRYLEHSLGTGDSQRGSDSGDRRYDGGQLFGRDDSQDDWAPVDQGRG